ncbi:MAG: IPT/TIG domain-containing protein [Candidatus Geothermincolia bacterium]
MRRRKLLPVLISLFLVALLAAALGAGCGSKSTASKPKIADIDPPAGAAGAQVSIIGSDMGDTQGTSVVHFGSKVADVVSWTTVLVTVKVPTGLPAAVAGVTVLTSAGQSNEYTFTVIASKQPDRKQGEIESNTPVQAMQAFEKKKGVSTAGWTFSVVKQSTQNPNWKIDQGGLPGKPPTYFLLKKVNNLWTVIDDGNALTATELKGDGAPADLWVDLPPKAPAKTQQQVILDYLTAKGIATTGVSITFVKQSKTDPTWQLFLADWPPQAQIPDAYFVLHQENGQWVVKNYGTDISQTPGMPADLKP